MNVEIGKKNAEREEIEKLISNQPTTMSKYQIDNFVINEKMTDYKILKQILLELGTRYTGYDDIKIDYQIENLELEILEKEIEEYPEGPNKKIAELKLQKKRNLIKGLEKTIKNHEYEIKILEDNFKKIKANYENPQDLLDDETGEEIYWVNKFIKEAQIDIMTTGRIGKGVLDAIMMLPDKLQEIIIQQAINQSTNSNCYISMNEDTIIEKIKENKKTSLMLNTLVGEKRE